MRSTADGGIIDFPLRGEWAVLQPPGHQREAFDLLAVDGPGRSYFARHWLRYAIGRLRVEESHSWSRPVYAPCTGVVISAADGRPDRAHVYLLKDAMMMFFVRPKVADGDLRPLAGNHVIVRCGSSFVTLAHLRAGTVKVRNGERMERGAPIGEVGNSGNSLVPHLHLEVRDGPNPLATRLVPFRLRRYERWTGEGWEEKREAGLGPGMRVRVRGGSSPAGSSAQGASHQALARATVISTACSAEENTICARDESERTRFGPAKTFALEHQSATPTSSAATSIR